MRRSLRLLPSRKYCLFIALCASLPVVSVLIVGGLVAPATSASSQVTTATCGKPVCTFDAFGPKRYARPARPARPPEGRDRDRNNDRDEKPSVFTDSFSVQNTATKYTLQVVADEDARAVIFLNGKQVLDEDDFREPRGEEHSGERESRREERDHDGHQEDREHSETVTADRVIALQLSNTLMVRLEGKPGSGITVTVIGVDNDAPTISAVATPGANSFNWNNTDVLVMFTCSDRTSGVAFCPAPVTVSKEGANQAVSGTATDRAGNTATATLTLNIEKTPPSISASASPGPNANGWNNSPVTITFKCAPSLAPLLSCPSSQTVGTEGAGQITSGTVTDVAGNNATTSLALNIDRTPPAIQADVTPFPDGRGISATGTTVTFTCSDTLSGIFTCPSPITVTTPGVQKIAGSAIDKAGNTDSISIDLNVEAAPLSITASATPAPNSAGWNDTPVTVSFQCKGGVPPIQCPPSQVVSTENDGQLANGTAVDAAGISVSASATIRLDKTPPLINITSPADGVNVAAGTAIIQGLISDALSGASAISCNGAPGSITGSVFSCPVTLTPGSNTISVSGTDLAGNSATAKRTLVFAHPVHVQITSPTALQLFSNNPITVQGTVDDPNATVTVGGVHAVVNNGAFTAAGVVLREDKNLLTATAVTPDGGEGSATVTVFLDTNPPVVHVDFPTDGITVTVPQIDVSGNVNDVVSGTVNGAQVSVVVNGVIATVANRSFAARDILLVPGFNTVTAVAKDRAGNISQHQVHVTLQQAAGQQTLAIVSGNRQSSAIRTNVPQPLVVQATDALGRPMANVPLNFAVSKSDGLIVSGQQRARILTVNTDLNGNASVQFQVGSRNGTSVNQVTVSAPGFLGPIAFSADSTIAAPSQIHTVSGDVQVGLVGTALPEPLVAIVMDAAANPVPNVPVTFKVTSGAGFLNGTTTLTQNTDSDGKAFAVLVLGQLEGINNNTVSVSFPGLGGPAAVFTSSSVVGGPVANTTVSGVVLDDANEPIPNATASIKGTNLSALTNASGRFTIANAPAGNIVLFIDGSTSTEADSYPTLSFQMSTLPGIDNSLPGPIYLPALDIDNSQVVGGDQDVVLTMKNVPGVAYKVFAHSVTFPDGSHVGRLTLSQVHADRVPMTPPNGQGPRLVGTLQPSGVKFDPPVQMTLPNTDGLIPGQVEEIFSFHHDLEQFVTEGTARVSEDGSEIVTDPGFGLTVSGWHGGGQTQPPTCAHHCKPVPVCQQNGRCGDDGNCQFDNVAQCTECRLGKQLGQCDGSGTCVPFTAGPKPTGNITIDKAVACRGGNVLAIHKKTGVKADNVKDLDEAINTCPQKEDRISNNHIRWTFSGGNPASKTAKNFNWTPPDIATNVHVSLELDDDDLVADDGPFMEVDTKELQTVIPDQENNAISGPAAACPNGGHGRGDFWTGTVDFGGCGVDFSGLSVHEIHQQNVVPTVNTCGFANLRFSTGGPSEQIDGHNSYGPDHLGLCVANDLTLPIDCTIESMTEWVIGPQNTTFVHHTNRFSIPRGRGGLDHLVTLRLSQLP